MASLTTENNKKKYNNMENLKIEQIHHVAYRCNNCKETVDWYKKVLNMDLTVAISEDRVPSTKDPNPYMHIFLDVGRGNILAFFELPNSPKMDLPVCGANTPVWVQHIAFQVSNESELLIWKKKLESFGIDVLGVTNHGIIKSIYFFDPNGHRLELTCWTSTPKQMAQLKEIAYPMVKEFSKTGIVSRQAQWLHADEFNPTGLKGISFVMFSNIGDKELLPNLFRRFGFSKTFCHKTLRIDQWTQGNINLLVDHESEFGLEFSKKHGPSIPAIGWLFNDANNAFEIAVSRGARPYEGSTPFDQSKAIYGIGDSLIFFFQVDGPNSISNYFIPNNESAEVNEDIGFEYIDHMTNNVEMGQINKWSNYYKDIFGFTEYRQFNIRGKETGLLSYALKSPDGSFCIPINEGTEEKSQIVEYLREYKGEGIQHLAFHTKDIITSMEKVSENIKFLTIDDAYYDGIFERVSNVKEDHGKIKDLQILVDNDGSQDGSGGYLLQIFTKEIIGPIFIELIQRENHGGFGEGNFGALFRSMEKEQGL
jgi:4-hydroxyphenylpyruvate dioxygenase